MWGNEVYKILAALLAGVWLIWLVNFIGDYLVPEHEQAKSAPAAKFTAKTPAKPQAKTPQARPKPKPAGGLAGLLRTADAAKGEKLAKKKCGICHTTKKGGKNRLGPNLWNVFGRTRGTVPKFKYSSGMKALGGKWTYADLDKYLTKPKDFLPKTKMVFPGAKKAAERAALIAYIRTLSDQPPPLP
jgi:cytochrome c